MAVRKSTQHQQNHIEAAIDHKFGESFLIGL